jgi:hypothetical protein
MVARAGSEDLNDAQRHSQAASRLIGSEKVWEWDPL